MGYEAKQHVDRQKIFKETGKENRCGYTLLCVCVCVCVFVCVRGKTERNRRWQKALTKHDKFWHTERLWQIYKLEALHPLRGLFLYKFISKLEESVEGKLHDHRRMNDQNKR